MDIVRSGTRILQLAEGIDVHNWVDVCWQRHSFGEVPSIT